MLKRLRRISGELTQARVGAFAAREEAAAVRAELAETRAALAALDARHDALMEALRVLVDGERANREGLARLRASADYARPFEEDEPLVSIVVPTYENVRDLVERSLPSALAQTYRNLEILVIGDAAPESTGRAIAELGDDRLRYRNLEHRAVYPSEPRAAWLTSGTQAYNEATRLARGLWICPLADDDRFLPTHVEGLLEAARRERWEVAYTYLVQRNRDGSTLRIGEFPPRLGAFGLQSTLYHAGLRFIELELSDHLFGEPNDWSLCRRWLRAGVRMGMLEADTAEYFPSDQWRGREGASSL